MDILTLALWVLRLAFVLLIYAFLYVLVRALWRDLRSTLASATEPLGRLLVLTSPGGQPEPGASIPVDAVTSLGRDVNNTVVVDHPDVAGDHAMLTYRGQVWYLEDRSSGRGTFLNGQPVPGIARLTFGDEIRLGPAVRLRLERAGGGSSASGT